MSTSKIICAILYVLFTLGTFYTVGNVSQFIDLNSFVFVAIIGAIYAYAGKGEATYLQKFGDGAVRVGWLGVLIGIVSIFGSSYFAGAGTNLGPLGAPLAIASLTVLYGYFFKLGSIILD